MGMRYCCYHGCKNTTKSAPNKHFFKFPSDPILQKLWLKNICNTDLAILPLNKLLYKHVCGDHFDRESFVNPNRERIYKQAVPRPFLVDDDEEETPQQFVTYGSSASMRKRQKMDSESDNEKEFEIRPAKPDDMVAVIKLIKELADFEKMSSEVKINSEVLRRDCFETEQPLFKCFVAELGSEIIGYAIFYNTYSTWLGKALYLEDLYVQAQHRKNKIGKSLFMAVAKHAYETSSRLDFSVLSWNPAMEFYKRFGAVNLTEIESWQHMRLNKEALSKLLTEI